MFELDLCISKRGRVVGLYENDNESSGRLLRGARNHHDGSDVT